MSTQLTALRARLRSAARPALAGLAGLVVVALAGCGQLAMLPQVDVVQPTAALPSPQPWAVGAGQAAGAPAKLNALNMADSAHLQAPAAARRPSGAIFQADRYRPLFENHRARLVGDTLTVNIVEKVSAVQKSTSTMDREGSLRSGIAALPFLKPSALTRMGAEANNANSFTGKGTTENSNDFSGVITATVVQVLPNGHLVVSAEKQVGVNANVDVLRFSGQVDPQAIAPGNTVPSTAIANVRVEQRGRGQAAEAQSVGWLARFFLNVMPI